MPWIPPHNGDAAGEPQEVGRFERASALRAFLSQDVSRLTPFRGKIVRRTSDVEERIRRAERMLGVDVARRVREGVELNVKRSGKAQIDRYELKDEKPNRE